MYLLEQYIPGSGLLTFGFILRVGVGSVYILPPPYPAWQDWVCCCCFETMEQSCKWFMEPTIFLQIPFVVLGIWSKPTSSPYIALITWTHKWFRLECNLHLQFWRSAWLKALNLPITNPPFSLDANIFSHLIQIIFSRLSLNLKRS